jgi:hypothetical protein
MVSTAVFVTDPSVALMFAVLFEVTDFVVMVKVAVVLPVETFTVEETTAAPILLFSATEAPATAGAFKVTVPVEVFPPVTLAGDRVSDCTAIGMTFREALESYPLRLPVIVTVVLDVTAFV